MSNFIKMTLKCDFIFGFKKIRTRDYPSSTVHCSKLEPPNWVKIFSLVWGIPHKRMKKTSQSFKGVMLPPICLIPPVPHCSLCKGYQSSSIQGIEVLSIKVTVWHSKFILAHAVGIFTCSNGPLHRNDRPPLRKRIRYKPFPFQLGLSSRHEVCTYCYADGLVI